MAATGYSVKVVIAEVVIAEVAIVGLGWAGLLLLLLLLLRLLLLLYVTSRPEYGYYLLPIGLNHLLSI